MNRPENDPENESNASESPKLSLSLPNHALDQLRTGIGEAASYEERMREINTELRVRSDPDRVMPRKAIELPWSREARARSRARDISAEARLDIFKDDLRAIRIANEVLNRAATMRAVEAAEAVIFELRCLGETARFSILNRTHLEMTQQFLEQIESIESFRNRLTGEILDALKERALNEFTTRMNRASKADVEFSKSDILKLKS
jgi:hypothetical protein